MSVTDGLQEHYLDILNLSTSKNIRLYKKAIFGLKESNRYVLIRFKWTEFYQELEDNVPSFVFKPAALIVTTIYGIHVHTEAKNIAIYYPYITQAMVYLNYEILWSDNSGAGLGRHPISNYR